MTNDNSQLTISNSPLKRPNYVRLKVANDEIKNTIFNHPEFTAFGKQMEQVFEQWKTETIAYTKALDKGLRPKHQIHIISENLLKHYDNKQLTDKYAMYQHLMDYWSPDGNDEAMQDDFYEIAADGWAVGNEVRRKEKKTKASTGSAQEKAGVIKFVPGIEGLEGRLIPPALMIQEYFSNEQKAIEELEAQAETLNARMEELRDEHGGEDGLLANAIDDKGKISKAGLAKAIAESKANLKLWKKEQPAMAAEPVIAYGDEKDCSPQDELSVLTLYKKLMDDEIQIQTYIKASKAELEKKVIAQYPKLSIDEIKTIVVEKKWMANMEQRIRTEMDNISHRLTQRIKELADRYETPMPKLTNEVAFLTSKVEDHLKKMNYKW